MQALQIKLLLNHLPQQGRRLKRLTMPHQHLLLRQKQEGLLFGGLAYISLWVKHERSHPCHFSLFSSFPSYISVASCHSKNKKEEIIQFEIDKKITINIHNGRPVGGKQKWQSKQSKQNDKYMFVSYCYNYFAFAAGAKVFT